MRCGEKPKAIFFIGRRASGDVFGSESRRFVAAIATVVAFHGNGNNMRNAEEPGAMTLCVRTGCDMLRV